jgi:hypothetical protein
MKVKSPAVHPGFSFLQRLFLFCLLVSGMTQSIAAEPAPLIAPAVSTQTGLLLEPPLDLSWFSRAEPPRSRRCSGLSVWFGSWSSQYWE